MAGYKLSEDAYSVLENIYEYSLLNFGEQTADEYYLSLHQSFQLVADQPKLGREFHEFRRHEHRSHVFFYIITDYGILIVNIYHQKENIDVKMQ